MKGAAVRNGAMAVLLASGGILAGLAGAEIGLALFFPQGVRVTRAAVNFFVRYDPDLGWVNRPGASGALQPPDDRLPPTRVAINDQGVRGTTVRVPKPNGEKRILFLGDSNTFGYGIDEDARFSDLLEGRLRGYGTVNLGVFGYGTDQEAMLLEREGLRFQPDLVVAGFSAGDLADNRASVNTGVSKPFLKLHNGRVMLHNIPVPPPGERTLVKTGSAAVEFLYRNSHLYRLVNERLNQASMLMPDSVFEMSQEEGMEVTVAILEGMNRVCRENGSRFAVLLLSHGTWIEALSRDRRQDVGYYPVLTRLLAARGITVIDTTETFVEETMKGKKLFFDRDPVHLNREGNRVTAKVLHEGLLGYGLLR